MLAPAVLGPPVILCSVIPALTPVARLEWCLCERQATLEKHEKSGGFGCHCVQKLMRETGEDRREIPGKASKLYNLPRQRFSRRGRNWALVSKRHTASYPGPRFQATMQQCSRSRGISPKLSVLTAEGVEARLGTRSMHGNRAESASMDSRWMWLLD